MGVVTQKISHAAFLPFQEVGIYMISTFAINRSIAQRAWFDPLLSVKIWVIVQVCQRQEVCHQPSADTFGVRILRMRRVRR